MHTFTLCIYIIIYILTYTHTYLCWFLQPTWPSVALQTSCALCSRGSPSGPNLNCFSVTDSSSIKSGSIMKYHYNISYNYGIAMIIIVCYLPSSGVLKPWDFSASPIAHGAWLGHRLWAAVKSEIQTCGDFELALRVGLYNLKWPWGVKSVKYHMNPYDIIAYHIIFYLNCYFVFFCRLLSDSPMCVLEHTFIFLEFSMRTCSSKLSKSDTCFCRRKANLTYYIYNWCPSIKWSSWMNMDTQKRETMIRCCQDYTSHTICKNDQTIRTRVSWKHM